MATNLIIFVADGVSKPLVIFLLAKYKKKPFQLTLYIYHTFSEKYGYLMETKSKQFYKAFFGFQYNIFDKLSSNTGIWLIFSYTPYRSLGHVAVCLEYFCQSWPYDKMCSIQVFQPFLVRHGICSHKYCVPYSSVWLITGTCIVLFLIWAGH